jgi:hypothetical protein
VSRLKGCNGHVWAKVGRRVRASGQVLVYNDSFADFTHGENPFCVAGGRFLVDLEGRIRAGT